MKSRRLTETDMANMSFLPIAEKRRRLDAYIAPKKIVGSYEPFRSTIGDALNEQFPFLSEEHGATSLGDLEKRVSDGCKGDPDLLAMNLPVARATHAFSQAENLTAARHEIRPITLAFGHKYEFGMPLILRAPDYVCAAFPDLRRTNQVNERGAVFIASMMHQRLRANNPDFAELRLQIWRYANNFSRSVRAIQIPDELLISYELLIADVQETYEILHTAMRDAEMVKRSGKGSDAGPLFASR